MPRSINPPTAKHLVRVKKQLSSTVGRAGKDFRNREKHSCKASHGGLGACKILPNSALPLGATPEGQPNERTDPHQASNQTNKQTNKPETQKASQWIDCGNSNYIVERPAPLLRRNNGPPVRENCSKATHNLGLPCAGT